VLLGAKKLLAKLLEKLTGVSAGAEGGDYQSPSVEAGSKASAGDRSNSFGLLWQLHSPLHRRPQ
jgi:hypothetical protein